MRNSLTKNIIWCIYIFYLFTIIAFGDRIEFYQISNITFIVLMLSMGVYIVRRSLVIPVDLFMFLPFLLFSFLSLIWSYIPESTLQRDITLLRLFFLFVIMAFYLYLSKDILRFIYGLPIAGIFIILYIFGFYGFAGLRQMIDDGLRVGEEFVNSNTLAIYLSFSALIFLYQYIHNHKWFELLLSIVFVIIIAATGSKKGLLDLAVGFFLVTGMNQESPDKWKRLFKRIIGIVIVAICAYYLWQTPLFATVRDRFEIMLNTILGRGARIDYSTYDRQLMLISGFQQFIKTPILGIGIGASGYLTQIVLGQNTYLHNEYIEILATGGIIGFILQFAPILRILVNNWKYRKVSSEAQLCTIIMAIYLTNGFAAVQYFSKLSYVLFAISLACYLSVNRENREMKDIKTL